MAMAVLERVGDQELIATFIAISSIDESKEEVAETEPLKVVIKRKSRSSWEPDAIQIALIERVPIAVGKILRGVFRREKEVISLLAQGKNPFENSTQKTASAMYQILQNKIPVSKSRVRQELAVILGWSDAAASVQASIVWRVFRELGIGIEEPEGRMVLNPLINGETTKLYYRN